MCFFKMPSVQASAPVPSRPAVTETFSDTPQAPVFGTSSTDPSPETSTNDKARGISSLKIKPTAAIPAVTGANAYGLNSQR